MKIAIIGMPGSGKTTIFNALTRGRAEVAAYSPTLAPNAGAAKVPDFASRIALIEAGLEEPVLLAGNLAARRDFTDVRDIARAYYLALAKGVTGEVYNVGSSRCYAICEVLDRLLEMSRVSVKVEVDPDRMRPSDVPTQVCDPRRFQADTGWEPELDLACSLRDTLDYWRDRVGIG